MTKSTAANIRDELDALRREIDAIRSHRKNGNGDSDNLLGLDISGVTEQLRKLTSEVSDYAGETGQNIERGVTNHPLSSVLGALAIGIVIGKVMR
jgi:hypothetical protein